MLEGMNNITNNNKMVGVTNTRVAKSIINNSAILRVARAATNIGILRKEMKDVMEQNDFASIFPVTARQREPEGPLHREYVYFTIPVNKVKQELYKKLFSPNIKDGPLNKKARAKITPIFEKTLVELGIESIEIPAYILKLNHINSVFKAEINSPTFALLVESERMRKCKGELAFFSYIEDKPIINRYSKNRDHPRIYNMFNQMSSDIRKHVFKNIYGVDMVEIDLTNSIIQCLASHGKCTRMLDAISSNTLLCSYDNGLREIQKENMLKWIFTMISPRKNMNGIKTRRKNELKLFLSKYFSDEVDSFIKAIENLPSTHTLFHYEDILREFCKQHPVCINIHDAVYIPANRTDLIKKLTSLLDSQKYFYKINPL